MIEGLCQVIDGRFFTGFFKHQGVGDGQRGRHAQDVDLLRVFHVFDGMRVFMTHQHHPDEFSIGFERNGDFKEDGIQIASIVIPHRLKEGVGIELLAGDELVVLVEPQHEGVLARHRHAQVLQAFTGHVERVGFVLFIVKEKVIAQVTADVSNGRHERFRDG